MLAFSKLFSKRVSFLSNIRNFVANNFDGGLSWTYIHPYQAVKIDLCDASSSKRWTTEGADKEFRQCLASNIIEWKKEGNSSVWLHIPIELSHLISKAASLGFIFHHARQRHSVLNLWLDSSRPSKIPPYGTHQVGVAGIVYREDTDEVLMLQDKYNYKTVKWKFPGGYSDYSEDIADTAVREVHEETGVQAEFKSVIAFRQHHQIPRSFNQSDLYFLCRMTPITYDITPCPDEVIECQWIKLNTLTQANDVTPLVHVIVKLLQFGKVNGFKSIDNYSYEISSVYPGLKYKLFYRSENPHETHT